MALDNEQRIRYARNIALADIGPEGQERICNAGVLIVGAGALGSLAAMYLAGAGVGRMAIIDFDTVDLSNLQRQIIYNVDDAGNSKAETLVRRVMALNPGVTAVAHNEAFTRFLAPILIPGYDIVLECTDTPAAKQLVVDSAIAAGKPVVSGGVSGWDGQVLTLLPGPATPAFADIFGEVGNGTGCGLTGCAQGGVAGPAAGVISSLQALEALRILAGATGYSHLSVFAGGVLTRHLL